MRLFWPVTSLFPHGLAFIYLELHSYLTIALKLPLTTPLGILITVLFLLSSY